MINQIKIIIFVQDKTDGDIKNYFVDEDLHIRNSVNLSREDVIDAQLDKATKKIRAIIREKQE